MWKASSEVSISLTKLEGTARDIMTQAIRDNEVRNTTIDWKKTIDSLQGPLKTGVDALNKINSEDRNNMRNAHNVHNSGNRTTNYNIGFGKSSGGTDAGDISRAFIGAGGVVAGMFMFNRIGGTLSAMKKEQKQLLYLTECQGILSGVRQGILSGMRPNGDKELLDHYALLSETSIKALKQNSKQRIEDGFVIGGFASSAVIAVVGAALALPAVMGTSVVAAVGTGFYWAFKRGFTRESRSTKQTSYITALQNQLSAVDNLKSKTIDTEIAMSHALQQPIDRKVRANGKIVFAVEEAEAIKKQ